MSDLKRLMDEYRLRINDPSYVAPDELRGLNRSKASPKKVISPEDNTLESVISEMRQKLVNEPKLRPSSYFEMPFEDYDMDDIKAVLTR